MAFTLFTMEVIVFLCIGLFFGFRSRAAKKIHYVGYAVTATVLLLLCLLGFEMGGKSDWQAFKAMAASAGVLTFAGIAGSIVVLAAVNKLFIKK